MVDRSSGLPEIVGHDELNRAVRDAVERVAFEDVANAFVAALRPRRFEHWSSLLSFALARRLPDHEFSALPGRPACRVCGAYARLHVFPSNGFQTARCTGAGIRDSLRYTLYDLELFRRDVVNEPDEADRAFFDLAISRIASVRAGGKTFAAEAALGAVFPSRLDRKLFLGVLGTCGVLVSPARPGFWPSFVPYEDRAYLDPSPYTYPVTWWRRSYGIDDAALQAFGLGRFLSQVTTRSLGVVAWRA